ncbi:MAG: ATP-dependent metallopeptidase FtsH/Yme1/Tma family protein [Proteobacteria bacterium]|nr:ATP-dependent metallopeptidase FtsH/Yme1/Tma family protein [Pseudomonadota bacterium]
MKSKGGGWFLAFLIVWAALMLRDIFRAQERIENVPYSRFLALVSNQAVSTVRITSNRIEGEYLRPPLKSPVRFTTIRAEDPELVARLERGRIPFEALSENSFFRDLLSWVVPVLVLGFFWWFILGRMGRGQTQLGTLGRARAKVFVERDLKIRFNDVAGVDEAKQELEEVVEFLKAPEHYQRLGGRMPKGILLVGPPGTGKTLLARAVAGEANVPFFSINGSEFVEMFVGLGAARVRDLFEQARSHAPCIIFIDEMDALGKARGVSVISGGANDEKEQTLNQLLAELDGFDPSKGVVLLAATNRPEILDPALLRSGRFDRQVVIDMPDRNGRSAILKIHLKRSKCAGSIRVEDLAGLTTGFSGADLENLVNEATLIATRRGAVEVEMSDFTAGIERIVGGLERKSRILRPEEKERVAFHEMGHATVSLALEQGETVHKVSIIPRGIGALGYTMRRPTEDRYLMDRRELESRLSILLAGRASEAAFFKEISTGAADDLDKATDIAHAMITRYGMASELGLMSYGKPVSPFLSPELRAQNFDYSDETARLIDHEISRLLEHAFTQASRLVHAHEDFIRRCVSVLLANEVLDESEIRTLWTQHLGEIRSPANGTLTPGTHSGVASGSA